jgi:uncharacterized integral membrane protein
MKTKLGISLVLAFLAFILISQNTETVSVQFLAWSAEMSLVVLVLIVLGTGVLIGWLLNSYLRFVCTRKQVKVQQTPLKKEVAKHGEKETDE